jgi:hypothetical protein
MFRFVLIFFAALPIALFREVCAAQRDLEYYM